MRRRSSKVRQIVDALPLPEPWDVDQLIGRVADLSGRPIRVEARQAMGDTITGTIFRLSAEDVIFYREDLNGLHRDHVLCHELGHMLGGHLEGPAAYHGGADGNLVHAAERIMRRQCHYGERREVEAEVIAELILARVRQQVRGVQNPATERAVRGFGAAMQ
jgi:hypothetical protein